MRRLPAVVPAVLAVALALPGGASADTCLGEPCPYSSATTIGQSGGGVLRFPQTVAIGPDGHVYVGDQSSRIIQVFTQDGQFVRQFGTPGTRPGQISAVSGVTVAPNGTVGVTDGGTDRVLLYDAQGGLYGSIGGTGTGVGQFRFGAGGGNDSPAGGAITFGGGYFYISDSGNDRVQRMNLDGTNQMVFVPAGEVNHPRGIAVRGDQVVIADDHNHRLAVYNTAGRLLRYVGQGQGSGPGQLSFPFGAAFDPAGRLFIADDLNHRVVRFGPAPDYKYKARWGSGGYNRPGSLIYPRAIATDNQGRVYVTNTGNDRIDVFSNSGTLLSSFGRSGRGPGQFNTPGGMASDASGIRAVTDTINGRVQLLNADGSVASIWGSPRPGPTILKRPIDVVFDPAGNGFVLDQREGRIVAFDRSTALPTVSFGQNGTGPGQLLGPSALARAADGTLLVADTGNVRVAKFSPAGDYLGSFATPEPPRGIALSPDGTKVYVTTTRNRVEIFDANGKNLGRFGFGPGRRLGQLSAPADLTVDAAGTVWIADRGNNRVAYFDAGGKRLGTFGVRGSGDRGEFSGPSDVSITCNGTLAVSDTRNNVVRVLTLTAPANQTCTSLPTPAPAPALQYPTIAPPEGPEITTRALRATNLLQRGIALRVGCDTTCTLEVSATLSQVGRPPKRRGAVRRPVSIRLVTTTTKIDGGSSKIVRLAVPVSARKRLARALGAQRRVNASIELIGSGESGTRTSADLQIAGTR